MQMFTHVYLSLAADFSHSLTVMAISTLVTSFFNNSLRPKT